MYRLDDEAKRKLVVRLREEVGCGVLTAKKCLVEANYVYDKALDIFKTKGYLIESTCLITKR